MSSITHSTASADRAIGGAPAHWALRVWLFAVAGLIFAMVIVGGATRLTDSGLSITEWQPLLGAIPPLSEADWLGAFEKYKQIPEYTLVNEGMSLSAFKAIYWWEWAHRFLGRFIGVAFFVPFVLFWLRGAIPAGLMPRLITLFLLGGAQGALGWYMVQSGLVDRIDVSQYRLTAHLGLAVLIFGAILWVAFGLRDRSHETRAGRGLIAVAGIFAVLVYLQILLGGFVAGTDAGLSHNTWPLMDGQIIPNGLLIMKPWYLNPFENVLTVQFNHRMAAYLIAALAVFNLWLASRSGDGQARRLSLMAAAIVTGQITLGIFALLTQLQIGLALAHQAGALILFAFALYQFRTLAAVRNA
ncbi:MAG TPA: COX15/CtaA family protein [Hyphomicrobiales bacterium]|nr:COX15/CtaA family protein [Hyphomicrobiales bacterium]